MSSKSSVSGGDEPAFLVIGTDVSAKYKGAFCEAKIKKMTRNVKCKVSLKAGNGSLTVDDELVRGTVRVGAHVELKHPDKGNQLVEAVITKIMDQSVYTVVFDDGDEAILKRTSLCLKSGKHFAESQTLDQLPLTNPEHFGNPVSLGRRRRRRMQNNSDSEDDETIEVETRPNLERDPDWGKVVCVDYGDKRGSKKDIWFPALIVAPTAQENTTKIGKDEHLVKSFKDGRFYRVTKKDTREFTKEMALTKSESNSSTLRSAMEKAIAFAERQDLPQQWDYDLLMGNFVPQVEEDLESSDSDSLEESDDEQSEEKDRFVAQLYKYMDERGTPINRAPSAGGRDLNLYKLYRIVVKMGGYNRVTNKNSWRAVYSKLGLPQTGSQPGKDSSAVYQLKAAYKKYLHAFDDFYRKLGCTMVSANSRTSRPARKERIREETIERPVVKKSSKRDKEPKKVVEESAESEKDGQSSNSNSGNANTKREKEVKEEVKQEEVKVKQEKEKEENKHLKIYETTAEDRKRGRGRKRREEIAVDEPPVDEDTMTGQSNVDESEEEDPKNSKIDESNIKVGDGLKVKYGRGRQLKVYEAKVLKIELDQIKNKNKYFVHYSGWNSRYDEWIKRSRIVQVLRDRSPRRRSGKVKNKGEPLQEVTTTSTIASTTASQPTPAHTSSTTSLSSTSSVQSSVITHTASSSTSNVIAANIESVEGLKSSTSQPPKRGRPPNSTKSVTSDKSQSQTQSQSQSQSQSAQPTSQSSQSGSQTPVRRGRPPLSNKKEKITRSKSINDDQSTSDSQSMIEAIDRYCRYPDDDRKRNAELLDLSFDTDASDQKFISDSSVPNDELPIKISEPELLDENTVENKNVEENLSSNENIISDKTDYKIDDKQFTTDSEIDESISAFDLKREIDSCAKTEETSPVKDAFDFDDEEEMVKEEEPLKEQLKKKRKPKDESRRSTNTGSSNSSANENKEKEKSSSTTRKYSKKSRKSIIETHDSDDSKDDHKEMPSISIAGKDGNEKKTLKSAVFAVENQKDSDSSTKRKGRKRKDEEVVVPPIKKRTKPVKLEIPEEDSNLEVQKFFEKTACLDNSSPVEEMKVLPQFTTDINPSQQSTADFVSSDFLICEEAVPASPEKEISPDEAMPLDESSPVNASPESGNSSPSGSPEEDINKDNKGGGSGFNSEIENEPLMKDQSKIMESMPSPYRDDDLVCRADGNKSPISPKKRRRGRIRTVSQSESTHQSKERIGCKTRGSSVRHRGERHSPLTALELRSPFTASSHVSFDNIVPQSKYNFCTPIDESVDPDRRIIILQERLSELRKTYLNIKAEVASLERKKKKARRKEREKKEMIKNNGNNNNNNNGNNGNNSNNNVVNISIDSGSYGTHRFGDLAAKVIDELSKAESFSTPTITSAFPSGSSTSMS